ncbi:MAG: hypothetical protein LBJ18_02735 [Rickettsiales bacterium]|jgi:hypothetical protein|nr:hypothetical protein [Rickettsiales bacterium]
MTEILIAFAQNIGAGFAVVAFIIVGGIWAVIKLRDLSKAYKAHDSKICEIEPEIKNINSKLSEIDGSVKTILAIGITGGSQLAQAHSPVRLNDKGIEISKELEAEKIFNKYKNTLINEVENKKPLTAYDIQITSFAIAATILPKLLEQVELEKMKNVAFQKGQILEQMWVIFGIYLRDSVLELRNIPLSDCDKK